MSLDNDKTFKKIHSALRKAKGMRRAHIYSNLDIYRLKDNLYAKGYCEITDAKGSTCYKFAIKSEDEGDTWTFSEKAWYNGITSSGPLHLIESPFSREFVQRIEKVNPI